uniref:Uncharacterized protein n=1 Tax=Salix viminalis TaxID=40686 RepID=A0A6N2KZH7_SALVM
MAGRIAHSGCCSWAVRGSDLASDGRCRLCDWWLWLLIQLNIKITRLEGEVVDSFVTLHEVIIKEINHELY